MTPLRLGDIQFLNSWPVTYALRSGIVKNPLPIRWVSAPPAEINRRLLTGELDAAAVSSLLYLRHPEELVPVPELCIRSDQGVKSVLVVSRQPLSTLKGRTVGVSNQGATTPALLKVLSRQRGLRINLETTPLRYPEILKEYPAALLIGDEALQASQSAEDLQWWDLGEAWTRWTKQPFVYALWVVRRSLLEADPEILERVTEALSDSLEWGRGHERELIGAMRREFPFEATFLRRYLEGLSYRLDERAWRGLMRFAREAQAVGELPMRTARKIRRQQREKKHALC